MTGLEERMHGYLITIFHYLRRFPDERGLG